MLSCSVQIHHEIPMEAVVYTENCPENTSSSLNAIPKGNRNWTEFHWRFQDVQSRIYSQKPPNMLTEWSFQCSLYNTVNGEYFNLWLCVTLEEETLCLIGQGENIGLEEYFVILVARLWCPSLSICLLLCVFIFLSGFSPLAPRV